MRLPAPPGMHPERGPHGTRVWGPPGPGSLPQCSGGGMQEGLAPGRVWEAPSPPALSEPGCGEQDMSRSRPHEARSEWGIQGDNRSF